MIKDIIDYIDRHPSGSIDLIEHFSFKVGKQNFINIDTLRVLLLVLKKIPRLTQLTFLNYEPNCLKAEEFEILFQTL